MCGIAGFILLFPEAPVDLEARAIRMGGGIVTAGPTMLAFGSSELGTAGTPAPSDSRPLICWSPTDDQRICRYVIAFNGEIYNHLTCSQLGCAGTSWRVIQTRNLLAAIEVWGLETLQRA